jgi:hypothetical protein
LQWGFASAALILLLAGGYLLFENLRLRNQMTQTQAERMALEQRERELQSQLKERSSVDSESEKELQRVRERLAQLEQLLAERKLGESESGQRELKVIAFSLAPQTRGIGQVPTLTLQPGTDYVALTLELETDDFPAYRAALKNSATSQIVWRSARLKPASKVKSVGVRLPASLLKAQNYVLELSGISRAGKAENLSSYPFRVLK